MNTLKLKVIYGIFCFFISSLCLAVSCYLSVFSESEKVLHTEMKPVLSEADCYYRAIKRASEYQMSREDTVSVAWMDNPLSSFTLFRDWDGWVTAATPSVFKNPSTGDRRIYEKGPYASQLNGFLSLCEEMESKIKEETILQHFTASFTMAAWISKETPSSVLGLYQEIHGTYKIESTTAAHMAIGLLMGGRGKESIATAIEVYNSIYESYRGLWYPKFIPRSLTIAILASGGDVKDVSLALSIHKKIYKRVGSIADRLGGVSSGIASYLTVGMLMGNRDESFIPDIVAFYNDLKRLTHDDYGINWLGMVTMAAFASKKDRDEIRAILTLPFYSNPSFDELEEYFSSVAITAILLSDFTEDRQTIDRPGD